MYEFVEVVGTNATLCIFDIDIVSLRFPFTFYVTPLDTLLHWVIMKKQKKPFCTCLVFLFVVL